METVDQAVQPEERPPEPPPDNGSRPDPIEIAEVDAARLRRLFELQATS